MLRALFKILSLMADFKAIENGTYHKRYMRKKAHRAINKWLR